MAASPISIAYGNSPLLSEVTNDILLSELRKIQSTPALKSYVNALVDNTSYYDMYKPSDKNDLLELIAFDAFVIVENAFKLKNPSASFYDINSMNRSSFNGHNKFSLPFFHLVLASSALLYAAEDLHQNINYPVSHIAQDSITISYIRGRLLDFAVMGPGYWGDSDWGLERVIRNARSSQSVFLGGAVEKLIAFFCNAQLLVEWKFGHPFSKTSELLLFAEHFVAKSKKIASIDLVTTGVAAYGHPNLAMPPIVRPNESQFSIPNNGHRLMSNDVQLLLPTNCHPLMTNENRLIPKDLNNSLMSSIYDSSSSRTFLSRFRQEAKNTATRLNNLGSEYQNIDRFPSLIIEKKVVNELEDVNSADHDNMSTISSLDDSLIIVNLPKSNFSASNQRHGSEDGIFKYSNAEYRSYDRSSDTESDGASKDSDSTNALSASRIVRRVKRKFEDRQAGELINRGDANPNNSALKVAAKGIQVTPVGTFRVQLNKTKNSSTKFTKNVSDLVDALWLFEIAVLICDKPKELNCLIKSGNYQYLLEHNYIQNSIDYKSKLGDYILLLHTKKILKAQQAEIAVAIFSNLKIDERFFNEESVDPIDLQNLLSLKG